jgi:galactokinase
VVFNSVRLIEPRTATARGPGRVNLIGEHTDYNGGLALPFPIALGCTVRAAAIEGGEMVALARDLGEDDRFALRDVRRAEGWRAFVRGTVAELAAAGFEVRPAQLTMAGDVPRGRGLSSSAALEVALVLALLALAGQADGADRVQLARLCSRVENDWVGARTGLLDQLAALVGEPGHALRIDFATLDLQPIPLRLRGWRLVALDSGAARTLASAEGYNARRAECERAAAQLGVRPLSAADPTAAARLPDPLNHRVEHVLAENGRVDAAVAALLAGDVAAVGPLLDASHASLRDLYDASVPAVEGARERLLAAGAAGARMMGGGFGGAVLGLFPPGTQPPADALDVEPGWPARVVG